MKYFYFLFSLSFEAKIKPRQFDSSLCFHEAVLKHVRPNSCFDS